MLIYVAVCGRSPFVVDRVHAGVSVVHEAQHAVGRVESAVGGEMGERWEMEESLVRNRQTLPSE